MVKPTTIGLLLMPFLISTTPLVFAEAYYYIPDHLLENPPLFCAMEFEYPEFPDAQEKIMVMADDFLSFAFPNGLYTSSEYLSKSGSSVSNISNYITNSY